MRTLVWTRTLYCSLKSNGKRNVSSCRGDRNFLRPTSCKIKSVLVGLTTISKDLQIWECRSWVGTKFCQMPHSQSRWWARMLHSHHYRHSTVEMTNHSLSYRTHRQMRIRTTFWAGKVSWWVNNGQNVRCRVARSSHGPRPSKQTTFTTWVRLTRRSHRSSSHQVVHTCSSTPWEVKTRTMG